MRRVVFLGLQIVFAAAVVWYAGGRIVQQWKSATAAGFGLQLSWGLVALSMLIVLANYELLIETWRYVVGSWGSHITRRAAIPIWFISNLGKYLPGKVWQIGAMGMLSHRAGVSPLAASGSAIVINLVNLLAGVGVIALTGASLLGDARVVVAGAVVLAGLVVLSPRLLPLLTRFAKQVTGRDLAIPPIPERAIWLAFGATTVAWFVYGLGFFVLAHGVTPNASGPVLSYVAVFTASYILGYVTLFAPGGLGVRDVSLAAFLDQLHLTTGGAGVLLAVASRLWLTVMDLVPGAIAFALGVESAKDTSREG